MGSLKKLFSWLLVIMWMAMIFNLSGKPAAVSNEMSTGVTAMVIKVIERLAPGVDIDVAGFNQVVRKGAHLFVYLILGILVLNGFRSSGVHKIKGVYWALLICVLYAISDEIHQVFVPGRGGQLRDVIIDSVGAVIGIGAYARLWRIRDDADRQEQLPSSVI